MKYIAIDSGTVTEKKKRTRIIAMKKTNTPHP
jgi:hypothetical protein